MTSDLDPLLKRLHLANARRVWSDLCQRAEKEEWSYETLLQTLFAEEVAHRRGTRLARAVRAAAFPFLRTIDEFDFTYQSTLRLTTIGSLLTPDFVTEGHAVIFEGKPGRGKTHLAIAIAYRAMQNGFDATTRARAPRARWRAHPHVRGDDLTKACTSSSGSGSPPRAWRRLDEGLHLLQRLRLTPTCVGTTPYATTSSAPTSAHPHVRSLRPRAVQHAEDERRRAVLRAVICGRLHAGPRLRLAIARFRPPLTG